MCNREAINNSKNAKWGEETHKIGQIIVLFSKNKNW